MFEKSIIRDSNRNLYPLITTVIGILSFTLVEQAFILLLPGGTSNQELVVWSIAVPIATVIMFTVLGMVQKNKVIQLMLISEVGLWVSFILGMLIGETFHHWFDSELFNYLAMALFTILFGIFIGMFFFGKEAILLFVVVCGLAVIPCGLLSDAGVIDNFPISFIYGTSVGLSVGLYKRRNKKTMTIAVVIIVITSIAIVVLSNFMNEQGYYGKYDSRRDVDEQIVIDEQTVINIADPNKVIYFEDQVFEMAIRDCFSLDEGDITWKDIGYRTELDSDDFQPKNRISTLEDLKWFVNLEKIEMQEFEVEGDLSSFSHMENLEVLLMWETDVSGDLSSLSGLENLRTINLNHTDVEGDISSLSTLVYLEELELKDTDVEGDSNSLNGLENLKFIELSDTNVTGR